MIRILTVIVLSVLMYTAVPSPEVAKFLKLDTHSGVFDSKSVSVPTQPKNIATEPLTALNIENPKPEPTPTPAATPVKCGDNQWVRADNGQCIDKPIAQTVQSTATVQDTGGGCSLAYSYSDWNARLAAAICMAESSGDVTNENWSDQHGQCSGSFGLMQIACFWFPYYGYSSADYHNGSVNMDIAHRIWQRQNGFGAWTTYTSGKYLKFY